MEGSTDGRSDTDCRFVANYVESKAIYWATLVAGIFDGDLETERPTDGRTDTDCRFSGNNGNPL